MLQNARGGGQGQVLLQQPQQRQRVQIQHQQPTTYRPVLQRRGDLVQVQVVPAVDYRVPVYATDGVHLTRLHQVDSQTDLLGFGAVSPLVARRISPAAQVQQAHARFHQYQGGQNVNSYHVQY